MIPLDGEHSPLYSEVISSEVTSLVATGADSGIFFTFSVTITNTFNRSVALTWVMFQSHRAGKMRTN
jgi:hypothetical protein